jgi:hypothetical protein
MLDARCTNAKKMRLRACAKKSLESATECGRVHAGRSAPRKLPRCYNAALLDTSSGTPRAVVRRRLSILQHSDGSV